MRHLAILISVLSITVCANAAMLITLEVLLTPDDIYLTPSDTAINWSCWAMGKFRQRAHIILVLWQDDPGTLI